MDAKYTLILGQSAGFIRIEGAENIESHVEFNKKLNSWQTGVSSTFIEIYDLSQWETTVPEVVDYIYKEQLEAIRSGRKHCIIIEGCQDWKSRIFYIYVNDESARETYVFAKTYNEALDKCAELGYDTSDIENKIHTYYSFVSEEEKKSICRV